MIGAEDGVDEGMAVGAVERGRPDGSSDTRLDEMRESVACAGCDEDGMVGADVNFEEEGAT